MNNGSTLIPPGRYREVMRESKVRKHGSTYHSVGVRLAVVRYVVALPIFCLLMLFLPSFGWYGVYFAVIVGGAALVSFLEAIYMTCSADDMSQIRVCWFAFLFNSLIHLDWFVLSYFWNIGFEFYKQSHMN